MGKYKLPWTNAGFQDATELELLTEYYEDLFEKYPNEMLKAAKGADGEVVFEETGDPIIDKWERELVMGIEPDLTEGMTPAAIAALKGEQEQYARARKGQRASSAIRGDFSPLNKSWAKDPSLEGKVMGSGNVNEEHDVLAQILGSDNK